MTSDSDLVFGELLDWYDIEVTSILSQSASLVKKINKLEKNLLSEYISYILSKDGFYNKTSLDLYPWDIKDNTTFTTEFTLNDWVLYVGVFNCMEEERGVETDAEHFFLTEQVENWSNLFYSDDNELIHVHFISSDWIWFFLEYKDGIRSFKWVEHYDDKIEGSTKHYIISHPKRYSEDKVSFKKLDAELQKRYGMKVLFTVDEFLNDILDDDDQKKELRKNWTGILEEILNNVKKEYPFLYKAKNEEKIRAMRDILSHAELNFALGESHYIDSVRNASLAIENILQILHEIHYPSDKHKHINLYDMTKKMRKELTGLFSETILPDLKYIRERRNAASHAPIQIPTQQETYLVLKKSQLFFELFNKWLNSMRLARS